MTKNVNSIIIIKEFNQRQTEKMKNVQNWLTKNAITKIYYLKKSNLTKFSF